MRGRHTTPSRWIPALAAMIGIVLLAGCGRVNLEDLTPEAVKTQQAQEAANRPTPTQPDPNASPGANGSPSSGGGVVPGGDIAAGASLYNAQCSGCHESGRAASLKGKTFDPAVEIPKLRTGEGFGVPHPKYSPTDITPLSDTDFEDIFAYLASQ
jgi:mono/diheme cytochrome c family protein